MVRLVELFGVPEGTTRVALSRMVAAGELHRWTRVGMRSRARPSSRAKRRKRRGGEALPAGGTVSGRWQW